MSIAYRSNAFTKLYLLYLQFGESYLCNTSFTVCRPKQADGFGKLHWYLNHSHSCGLNRTMRKYHYPVITGHGRTTFPKVALGSLHESLALFKKGHGVQSPLARCITNVSVCFIHLSKNYRLISLSKPIFKQINFDRVINLSQTEDAGKGVMRHSAG